MPITPFRLSVRSSRLSRFLIAGLLVPGVLIAGEFLASSTAEAQGFVPRVFKTPQERAADAYVPIEQRPNRLFHFYGNAVRSRYHVETTRRYQPMDYRRSDVAPPLTRRFVW